MSNLLLLVYILSAYTFYTYKLEFDNLNTVYKGFVSRNRELVLSLFGKSMYPCLSALNGIFM